MLTAKRVIIATICGFVFGLVCMYLATSNPEAADQLTTGIKWSIVFSRTLLGFAIGISALSITWWLNGIVIGVVASIPSAFAVMHDMTIFIGTIVMGIIYGVLTEVITTVIFKAKAVGKP